MSGERDNGKPGGGCPLGGRWGLNEEEIIGAMEKVSETHSLLNTLVAHTAHLPKIAQSNDDIKQYLVGAATGKDHVPLNVVQSLVKIGGWVIFGLITVIVFLLTGSKFGLFPGIH